METLPERTSTSPLSTVVIITGEGDQGQVIAAMAVVETALNNGQEPFHNGCSNIGIRLTREAMSSDARLAELMTIAPEQSVFVLADADCVPAVTSVSDRSGPQWLSTCVARQHLMVLTTVRGREYILQSATADAQTSHVQVEAAPQTPGLFLTQSAGDLRERFPVVRYQIDYKTMLGWAKLTDGSYQPPERPMSELIRTVPRTILVASNYAEAVQSVGTAYPKYPANPFLLTRTVQHDKNNQTRYTELVGFLWQESVNKRRDDEMAALTIQWACEKWGIELTDLEINPKTTYPDAEGNSLGDSVNVEVTKVQPRWPSGASLAALADGTRAGKAPAPMGKPIIQCQQCRDPIEVDGISDIHVLPDHDESHRWTCVYPGWMIGPDWPDVTALPELRINMEHLATVITERYLEKVDRAKRFGAEGGNWLVLVIEGFPPVEGFESFLRSFNWDGLDGVFATVSNEFGSAIHGHFPDDQRRIAVLKCPYGGRHICYHPGLVMVDRKADNTMDSLRDSPRDRGVSMQLTGGDGTILAEHEAAMRQPIAQLDVEKGIRAAHKILPF